MADDTKIWQLLPLVPGLLNAYNTVSPTPLEESFS